MGAMGAWRFGGQLTDESEQHRHRCEVRHYLQLTRKRGLPWLKNFVGGWKRWPDSQLQTDFWEQWKAGNNGKHGEWL